MLLQEGIAKRGASGEVIRVFLSDDATALPARREASIYSWAYLVISDSEPSDVSQGLLKIPPIEYGTSPLICMQLELCLNRPLIHSW